MNLEQAKMWIILQGKKPAKDAKSEKLKAMLLENKAKQIVKEINK